MTSAERTWAGLGAALMIIGSLGTWARGNTWDGTSESVGGLGEGSVVVLVLAVLVAVAAVLRQRLGTGLLAFAAALWTAFVMYSLPGELTAGPYQQADMAWGAYAAMLGALVALAAATLGPLAPWFEGRARPTRRPT